MGLQLYCSNSWRTVELETTAFLSWRHRHSVQSAVLLISYALKMDLTFHLRKNKSKDNTPDWSAAQKSMKDNEKNTFIILRQCLWQGFFQIHWKISRLSTFIMGTKALYETSCFMLCYWLFLKMTLLKHNHRPFGTVSVCVCV